MAGVPPIGIVIGEKARLYKIKHNMERSEYEYDAPLPAKDWPHPARRMVIKDIGDSTLYPVEIYTDGSKNGGKVGAGAALYMDKKLRRQCKYKLNSICSNNQAEQIAILESLEELTSLSDCNEKKAAIYTDSKVSFSLSEKQQYTQPPDCRNTKQGATTYEPELVDSLRMGEGTFWNRGKRAGRQTRQRSIRGRQIKYSLQ
jgi:ribonuclease HI